MAAPLSVSRDPSNTQLLYNDNSNQNILLNHPSKSDFTSAKDILAPVGIGSTHDVNLGNPILINADSEKTSEKKFPKMKSHSKSASKNVNKTQTVFKKEASGRKQSKVSVPQSPTQMQKEAKMSEMARKTMVDSVTQSFPEELSRDSPDRNDQASSPMMINVPSTKVVLHNSIASLPQSPGDFPDSPVKVQKKKAKPFGSQKPQNK